MLQILAILTSFIIVAFGQPTGSWILGIISAAFGYAIFWSVLLRYPKATHRFWISTAWFCAVQLVQLYWFVSHPYWYIYGVYLFVSLFLGLQFGLIGILINPNKIFNISKTLFIAAAWTLLEWSRLFIMSGFSFNLAGMALAGNVLTLQLASISGVFGLSFLVITTNLLALKTWMTGFQPSTFACWFVLAASPYLFGAAQYSYHSSKMARNSDYFDTILVQPCFPAEECLGLNSHQEWLNLVQKEWKQILVITKELKDAQPPDLIVLPEAVVPFGTYSFVYPYEQSVTAFHDIYGKDSLIKLPSLEWPFAIKSEASQGSQWLVNNAFWCQGIANFFEAPVIAGLEDAEDTGNGREYYAAAIYFPPQIPGANEPFQASRYAKRVLLPMAEYIPSEFCKKIAARYGITGSFTPGKHAEIWKSNGTPFGVSICYEETFGDLMRENAQKGAKVLVNLTSDIWYPNSSLVRQHLEHSRLRTVENGISLARSCNTGITCAIDSIGRDVALLGENDDQRQQLSASLRVKVPLYTYSTPYTRFGDKPLILLCFFLLPLVFWSRKKDV